MRNLNDFISTPDRLDNKKLEEKPVLHKLEGKYKISKKTVGIVASIITAGILSGYFLSVFSSKSGLSDSNKIRLNNSPKAKMVVGSADTKTFRDSAEGTLEKEGIDGEGTHRLLRPGGKSQTVYLTSSVLNLDDFVGKKVRIWGETFAAKKAGWLMDVGRVEVLE